MEEVIRSSGKQYDPDVVTAFVAMVEEKDRDFFRNSAAVVDRAVRVAMAADADENVRYFLKKSMVAEVAA